jgi:nitroimidazol reductase NimA-like FMN-containing flavoprotein (pyridoxamine 5'-phosphate oxidase superfamily)
MMGNLTPDQIDEVLRSEVVGRISYIADGWPYIVPVTYVYDGGEFVFSHSANGHKIEAMRKNHQVGFEVEQIRGVADWRTVLARGRFEEVALDQQERAMDFLAGKHASTPPPGVTTPERHEDVHRREGIVRPILFQIRLLERTGRYERA